MSMHLQPPRKKAAPPPRQGALKRDINLLPANEASAKLARKGTIALAVLVGALIVAYFAIAVPAFALHTLQGAVAAAENQAKLLAPAEADALAKIADRDKKQAIIAFAKGADNDNTQPADIMAALERACPGTLTLTSFTLDASGINVTGLAGDDEQVAQFIVNLKSTFPQYPAVTLVSASDTDKSITGWKRQFQISAMVAAPQASGSAAPAATAAPGEGGGAQ